MRYPIWLDCESKDLISSSTFHVEHLDKFRYFIGGNKKGKHKNGQKINLKTDMMRTLFFDVLWVTALKSPAFMYKLKKSEI